MNPIDNIGLHDPEFDGSGGAAEVARRLRQLASEVLRVGGYEREFFTLRTRQTLSSMS
ncbi:hypothetical protein [Cupriavidus sp. amp6]|uniref:hypothetical protein n=1 Tax=Cupriavidus sp. amp6 TaxID=388051 RepID=UPI000405E79C|nr:hypothetical protein [Cupriavidus sp. amp6]